MLMFGSGVGVLNRDDRLGSGDVVAIGAVTAGAGFGMAEVENKLPAFPRVAGVLADIPKEDGFNESPPLRDERLGSAGVVILVFVKV